MRMRQGDRTTKNGFALVVVIWGLGIIALLIISFMTTARLRLQSAFNIAGTAQATLLADAAINIAILGLLTEQGHSASPTGRLVHGGEPYYCALPGAIAAIVIEDEGGKVDLNGASQELLRALTEGFGMDRPEADRLTTNVVAYRAASTGDQKITDADYAESNRPFGPKHALFQTALELDQVVGVEPNLFRTLLPFVTVHSRRPKLDPLAAPPALFAALAGFSPEDVQRMANHPFPNNLDRSDPRFPQTFGHVSEGGVFLIHAEVLLPNGQTGLCEAIVDLTSVISGPYAIRELRHGYARYFDELRTMLKNGLFAALPGC
jgi:general secretion pathway protein K